MLPRERSILFADDDANDRYLMVAACKEGGMTNQVAVVEDGEEVLGYLNGAGKFSDRNKHPIPCLAILDVNMPRKSGIETLQWIRQSERWKLLPVLMLSASAHPRDVALAYRLGANVYLTKPSTVAELIELAAAINGFWVRFAEPAGEL